MSHRFRLLAPLSVALIALAGLAASGAAGSPSSAASPAVSATGSSGPSAGALSATITTCHSDPVLANRYAIFATQMVTVPGALTLSVNVALEERTPGGGAGFTPVSAPGFGVWVSSQPGVGIYTYSHEVTGLPAPAAFRVLVRARWLARRHRVIRETERISPVCTQPLLTADLAIGAISRVAGGAGGADAVGYRVRVINGGTAAAGPFAVTLKVGTVTLAPITVPGLAPGARQLVRFAGPPCAAGATLTAVADAAGVITEPANASRTRTVPCS